MSRSGTGGLRGPLVVTGTDTGVGKTIVTAAISAAATAHGLRVAVVKPGQTGIQGSVSAQPAVEPSLEPTAESDEDTIVRLAAPATARTLVTYPDPLAPLAAARVAGLMPLNRESVAAAVRVLAATHDLVLIEGAGGLLVPMGAGGWTIADLAGDLAGDLAADPAAAAPGAGAGSGVVVVTRAGLGTLNHTALTLEALARRGLEALVVIGAWPAEPELVHRTNLADFPDDLAGVVPDGAAALAPETFRASAPAWLAPALHGDFDPAKFRTSATHATPAS